MAKTYAPTMLCYSPRIPHLTTAISKILAGFFTASNTLKATTTTTAKGVCKAFQRKQFSKNTPTFAAAPHLVQHALIYPRKNTLKFQNHQRQMKAPYVIYADFESIIEKYDTCIPPTDRSSTTKTEVHKPCGFSLVAVRSDGEVKDKQARCYRGEDCVKQFLAALLQTVTEIREELTHKKKLQMTKEDWRAFDRAKECHICKKDLIRHNERDETEFWDPETGAYCGKVHKYKQAPVKGNKPMSCYQYMMNISSTDK